MDKNPGEGRTQEELLAEREEILRQLAALGSDSEEDDEDGEDDGKEEKQPVVEKSEDKKDLEDSKSPDDTLEGVKGCPFDNSPITPKEIAEKVGDTSGNSENSNSGRNSAGDENTAPVPVEKIVLDRQDKVKNWPLPEGWLAVSHTSGMLVYYHKFTQVVTHSRPYQIEGLVRNHDIPVCSIPCLYRDIMDRKHEEEEKRAKEPSTSEIEPEQIVAVPEEEKIMTPEEYREYCEKKFKFKTVVVHRYLKDSERSEMDRPNRVTSMLKKKGFDMDYEQLLSRNNPGEVLFSSKTGAVLIDMTPCTKVKKHRGGPKRPFLMNPMGKTTVAVLNEFVQQLAKGKLEYEYVDSRSFACPYKATAVLTMKTAYLNELVGEFKETLLVLSEISQVGSTAECPLDSKMFPIGRGTGANKKTARLVAAKDALSKLFPKLRVSEDHVCNGSIDEGKKSGYEEQSRELFKKVAVDSPNLVAMCSRFAIPKPYGLLKDAINKSLRWNGMELIMKKEMVSKGSQMSKVTLKLGDFEQEAVAIGVQAAQHLAAQHLFKQMHPEVHMYGSFLEMYGRLDDKSKFHNAKKQHDEVVRLTDTGNLLEPNTVVLAKLAEEMKSISLIYPPRKFLFGLAPQTAETNPTKKTVGVQTNIEERAPIPNLSFYPPPIMNPMIIPPFPGPSHSDDYYQHPKRGRYDNGPHQPSSSNYPFYPSRPPHN